MKLHSKLKPKHQVGGITLLGKLDSASVWNQVFKESICLNDLHLSDSFITSSLFLSKFISYYFVVGFY